MTEQVLSLTSDDQSWLLVTACLVFMMQAGFLCVEAGFSRAKHSMNVAVKNVTDYLAASVAFFFVGYGLMFGRSWLGVVGTTDYVPSLTTGNQACFFFFQLVFCGTAATIVSGAMAERMKFSAYLIYSFFISTFLYPLFGHWAWGGGYYLDHPGWLARLGYLDFAGSSVVHQMGGGVALAGIVVLGPRLGKFDAQGRPRRIIGHNIPLALLGVFILWFGWFGFNGGSTLHMNDTVGGVIVNTNLGGAAGALSALAVGWFLRKRPDISDVANGALGGLVAITAPAAYVTPLSALLIGTVAGPVVVASGEWLERGLKLDDVVGAIPVHGFCGVWGVLAAGLFAKPAFLLHPADRLYHVGIQTLGSAVCFLTAFGGGWLFFTCLHRLMGIRVSPEAERHGLNLSEHQASSSLQDLAETMHTIAQEKDWSQRTDMDPYSDAGELGIYFNQLLVVIERTIGELEAKRQDLERQQQQLTTTNAELERTERASLNIMEDLRRERVQLQTEVAQRKQVEEALQRTNARLNELSALKDEFVAKVSHELRTPLTSIKEGVSLLLDHALDPGEEQQDFLRTMDKDLDRLTELINNMLDLSKIEAGQLPLNRQPCDLRATIEAVIRSHQPLIGRRTVTTEWSDVPPVFADADRLFQVFGNLFSNAIKFTAEDGTITIRSAQQGEAVAVSVIDNGRGVAAAELPKLFQKFSQVGVRDPNQPKGTGLGLVICKELMVLHKGQITVTSQVGHGTTFTVVLPCYRPAFALTETFQQLQACVKKEGQTVGLLAIQRGLPAADNGSEPQRHAQLLDELRHKVKCEDMVLDLPPSWVVILAVTDAAGLTSMTQRLRELEAVQGLRLGVALSPDDGAEAEALFEHATRTLDQGLASPDRRRTPKPLPGARTDSPRPAGA